MADLRPGRGASGALGFLTITKFSAHRHYLLILLRPRPELRALRLDHHRHHQPEEVHEHHHLRDHHRRRQHRADEEPALIEVVLLREGTPVSPAQLVQGPRREGHEHAPHEQHRLRRLTLPQRQRGDEGQDLHRQHASDPRLGPVDGVVKTHPHLVTFAQRIGTHRLPHGIAGPPQQILANFQKVILLVQELLHVTTLNPSAPRD